MSQFKETRNGNLLLQADGFFISYRPHSVGILSGAGWDTEEASGETAIVFENKFFILNGDHREQYLAIAHAGLNECVSYFNANADKKSSWSDTPETMQ